jgi:hypothetical protein
MGMMQVGCEFILEAAEANAERSEREQSPHWMWFKGWCFHVENVCRLVLSFVLAGGPTNLLRANALSSVVIFNIQRGKFKSRLCTYLLVFSFHALH